MSGMGAGLRGKVEKVMRGEEPAGALSLPLAAAQALYGAGVAARNLLFDAGIRKARKAPCKVISVGALTVGGAGKTPFTELVVRKLKDRRAGILSRGYGGGFEERVHVVCDGARLGPPPPISADEPYMLAKTLKTVPVVLAPRKIEGARLLADRFGVEVIVLDDGFQSRAIHRDLDILLLDAKTIGEGGRLLPRGVLREPVESARRADIIAVTGGRGADMEGAAGKIRGITGRDIPVISVAGAITGFCGIGGEPLPKPDGPVLAFCGVAGPERFSGSLAAAGVEAAGTLCFPDHHHFTSADIDKIIARGKELGAAGFVTTQKDGARLIDFARRFGPSLYLAIYRMEITGGEEKLDEALASLFRERH